MGFLTNILNTAKKYTLDKTDLDERAGKAFNNVVRTGQNFFTQKLPQQYNQMALGADRFMRNDPKIFQRLPTAKPIFAAPSVGNIINRTVVQPALPILDQALETGYRKTMQGFDDYMNTLKTGQLPQRDSLPQQANDLLDLAVPLQLAKIPANMIGGAFGSTIKAGTNAYEGKPLTEGIGEAYDEGYGFSTKLGAIGKGTKILKPLLEKSPVIKQVIAKLTPQEVTGFKSWLSSSLKAGNKAGIDNAIFGALQDAENGSERLLNIAREYGMGAAFGTVIHGGQNIIPGVVKPAVNTYKKIPDKEAGSINLEEMFKKKIKDIETKKAEYDKGNYTPFSVGELQQKFLKDKAVPLPKTIDPNDAPVVKRIVDAMESASGKKFDRKRMEKALIQRFKDASPQDKQRMLESANFDKTLIADYVKQNKIGGHKPFFEQQNEDANRTLVDVEPPVERVKQPFGKNPLVEPQVKQPVQTVAPVTSQPARDVPTIRAKAEKVKSTVEHQEVLKDVESFRSDIGASLKQKGATYSDLVDQMESGNVKPELQAEATKVKEFYDAFKEVGRTRRSVIAGELKNYHHRISEKSYEKMAPKDFGSTIIDADYAKHRTGKLTEYIKDDRVLDAYAREAIGSPEPQKLAEAKLANEIIAEIQHKTADSPKAKAKVTDVVSEPKIDYFTKVKEAGLEPDGKVEYKPKAKQGILSRVFRGIEDRVARYGDDKFYKDFLYPFRNAQVQGEQVWAGLKNLDDASILKQYQMETGSKNTGVDKMTMLSTLLRSRTKDLQAGAVNTYLKNVKNSSIDNPELKQLVNDIGDEYITRDLVQKGFLKKLMGQIRAQTGRGALGLNVASAVNNLFEIKRLASSVSTKNLTTATKRWLKGERIHENYGRDSKTSTALERGRGRFKILQKADDALFYMFDKTETAKDDLMLLAFEEQGKSKGLKGDALFQYVDQKFSQFAIKYGKGQDIGLYRNDLVKTLGQFGQYAIKDIIIAGDKAQGAVKGDVGDMKYLAKYATLSVLQMMALQKIIGTIGFGGETGTPVDFVKKTLTKGNLQSPITTLGVLFAQEALAPEDEDDFTKQTRRDNMKRTGAVMTIPASNQLIFKTGKQAANQERGYYETKGGNVANETSKDLKNKVTSLVFGPSYDPKRQEYIKEYKKGDEPALNKVESKVYRSLPENERTAFLEQRVAKDQEKQQFNQTMKKNEEEPGLLDRIFNKKKEKQNVGLSLVDENATTGEVKDYNYQFDTKLNSDLEVSDEEIRARYFRTRTPNSADTSDREKAYAQIKSIQDRDDVSDEFKEQVVRASGAKKEDWEYYKKAKQNTRERRQEIIGIVENTRDRQEMIRTLMGYRKSVAGSKVVSNDDVDYLYDQGYLSEDEKKLINALKYDEIKDEYYFDRDYTGGGGGGGSGKAAQNKILSMFKDLMKEFEGKKSNSGGQAKKLLDLFDTPKDTESEKLQSLVAKKRTKVSDTPNVKAKAPSSKLLNKYLNK